MANLDESIRVIREALGGTPENYLNSVDLLHCLAIQLSQRYSWTGVMAGLEAAIQFGQKRSIRLQKVTTSIRLPRPSTRK